ncbi:MAG: signal peptidase II [Rickettsiales bacterium]|nr:signal peptidase II [Rickettsiales bacterium]
MLKKYWNEIKVNIIERKLFFVGLLISIVISIIDIFTKTLAFLKIDIFFLKTGGIYNYIKVNDYFNIVRVVNKGVSFGMFDNLLFGQIILSIITFCLIVFLLYSQWNNINHKLSMVSYSFIIGGGIGNLYDRVIYGGVRDFLDFHFEQYHWPAFNFADSMICIGVVLFLFFLNIEKVSINK